ncbi:BfmA/BtgA family mobilization protein [Cellulophaga sp. Hel_I_12]|uniref:BfmA/BtgA family mobilization protein n=1 Tax=Cellulophaga sp. Hel_I_12 TaxID=1249972 RepID=UPI00069242B3|nr:BfmA/BtgA family mobilization protein [Cellulophaga sp. Hel_I_12]
MDKGYEKEKFETIKIKSSVAKRFRNYCRIISKSQSMTLKHMVDFFELNGVSPEDNLGTTISSLKRQITQRTNAVIAIIKNIEKIHHKPTTAILQSLFEETAHLEKEEEVFDFQSPKLSTENEELDYFKKVYRQSQESNQQRIQAATMLFKKLVFVRNSFGTGHYRLNISKEQMAILKQKLTDVHHDNSTEIGS